MADLSRLPALLQAEDWAAAERLLRRAANAKSAPAEVFYNLAKVLEESGKSGQRVQWLRRAVLRRSDYAKAWFELGRAELEALDLRAAHRAFDKAHKLDPGDSDARRMFARLCLRLGQWDKAETAFGNAEDAEARLARYRIAAETGRSTRADRHALLLDQSLRPQALKALTRTAKGAIPLNLCQFRM
ncbi:Anaphase-promoting complex, cyclosome, subunit 3 [Roseovarius sp. THAF8]|uniref:tetratricopeptide repeat protein n=1 Tax=Roseovarius sp. THAF8 TaxID=2587846 RepID=UPI0012684F17|nr:tetratricopeptide repeat protein [Roseovarius sp. THAF8]QFT98649.1 Anaphase-promoting complex, cyclosome, subunit 3 [Roseovarius sp. THAF8]